jgi:hypothetical protein
MEATMDVLSKKDFDAHRMVVGWLQIVNGLIGIVIGAFVATLILGAGAFSASLMQAEGAGTEGSLLMRFMAITAAALGGLMFILAIPGVVAGIGLVRRASWSRVMALVLSAFELVLFPIGTILAAYTVFVLSQQAAIDAFGACCSVEDGRVSAASA